MESRIWRAIRGFGRHQDFVSARRVVSLAGRYLRRRRGLIGSTNGISDGGNTHDGGGGTELTLVTVLVNSDTDAAQWACESTT